MSDEIKVEKIPAGYSVNNGKCIRMAKSGSRRCRYLGKEYDSLRELAKALGYESGHFYYLRRSGKLEGEVEML